MINRALVTAGPTLSLIDPVRYISNRSSGKMGFAIAEELAKRCEIVYLVTGPTKLETNCQNIVVRPVETTEEMYLECLKYFYEVDVAVFAAAPADYKIKNYINEKIKNKNNDDIETVLNLELIPTIDIAKELGKLKTTQFTVGFALETHNEFRYAKQKLNSKNFDLIVLNSLQDKGAGFEHDTNKVTVISRYQDEVIDIPLKTKKELASDLVNIILQHQ